MARAIEAYGCRLDEWRPPDPTKWNYGSPPDHLWIPPKPSPKEYECEDHRLKHESLVSRVRRILESVDPHCGSNPTVRHCLSADAQRLIASLDKLLTDARYKVDGPGIDRVNSMFHALDVSGYPH